MMRVVQTGFDGDGGFGVPRRGAGFQDCSIGSKGVWVRGCGLFSQGRLDSGLGRPRRVARLGCDGREEVRRMAVFLFMINIF